MYAKTLQDNIHLCQTLQKFNHKQKSIVSLTHNESLNTSILNHDSESDLKVLKLK